MATLAPEARPLGPDAGGHWVCHWLSSSWTQSVDAWVTCRLAQRGRQIVGDPVTFRARFWSVVRCYPTAEGLVWFKETNPGHHFEARLTATMASLAPDHVVVPIAVDPDRGWILSNGSTMKFAFPRERRGCRLVTEMFPRVAGRLVGSPEV